MVIHSVFHQALESRVSACDINCDLVFRSAPSASYPQASRSL